MTVSRYPAPRLVSPLDQIALEVPANRARWLIRIQIAAILLVSSATSLLGIVAVSLPEDDRSPIVAALTLASVLGGLCIGLADLLHGRRVDALVKTASDLRQSAADRAADLARVNAMLRRQDERRSSLIATLSHELRTPLNAIVGCSRLLLDDPDDSLGDDRRSDVRRIHDGGRALLGIVDTTLDLARLDAGGVTVERGPVPIQAVLDAAISLLQPLANERGLMLEAADVSHVPLVAADEDRLSQVLVNLVGNAIKFTDLGGVRLTAEVVDRQVVVAVSDTGIGIPAAAHEAIFEPFWQVDQSRTRRRSGTGLGLAISRRLVDLMDGRVWVESYLGAGSTFYVALPRASRDNERVAFGAETPTCDVVLVGNDAGSHGLREALERRNISSRCVSAPDWSAQAPMLDPRLVLVDGALPQADVWRALAAAPGRLPARSHRTGLVELHGDAGLMMMLARLDVRSATDFERSLWSIARDLTATEGRGAEARDARVLVISANLAERRRIGVSFESVGLKTADAADFGEARAVARRIPILGIAIDPLLPRPGIVPLLAAIAVEPEWSSLPVLVSLPPALTAGQQRDLSESVDVWRRSDLQRVDQLAETVEAALTAYASPQGETGRQLWPVR